MWNKPTEKQLSAMPRLYSTENVSTQNKVIYMHFFMGGNDWYMAEYDPSEKLFFGYTVLNADWDNAEWGYISLEELKSIKQGFVEVDRDLHWKKTKFKDIKK
jgi:hypothetical protein